SRSGVTGMALRIMLSGGNIQPPWWATRSVSSGLVQGQEGGVRGKEDCYGTNPVGLDGVSM
ncbi:MAG: hypothetical protein NW202_16025, partial [Nitrospira sp.]|nr:hypothetical protein [Nitrospira sp.]